MQSKVWLLIGWSKRSERHDSAPEPDLIARAPCSEIRQAAHRRRRIIEFFGGILILVGIKTRYVAGLVPGHLAVIFVWRHFPDGFRPRQNAGESPVLFCFIFLPPWDLLMGLPGLRLMNDPTPS